MSLFFNYHFKHLLTVIFYSNKIDLVYDIKFYWNKTYLKKKQKQIKRQYQIFMAIYLLFCSGFLYSS